MASQFAQRIIQWLANDVLVKTLSQNKQFQNMALRTHLHVERTKEAGKEALEKAMDEAGREGAKIGANSPTFRPPPVTGFKGFVSAFGKEVKKDFGG